MEKQKFNLPKLNENKSLITQAFDEVICDKDVKAFIDKHQLSQEFILDNLAIFRRYSSENLPCRSCPGIKKCIKEPQGFDTLLVFGKGDLEIAYRPCLKSVQQSRINQNYYFRDFDEAWLEYQPETISLNPIRRKAYMQIFDLFKEDGNKHFYIHNDRAVGKSFMVAALCNHIVYNMDKPVAFVQAKNWIDKMRDAAYNNKSEYKKMLEKMDEAYLVVIDDIGSEKVTELSIEILTGVIDSRLKKQAPTIVTSNYDLNELESLYENYQLQAKRLLSRLNNSYQVIYLEGLDFRKVK